MPLATKSILARLFFCTSDLAHSKQSLSIVCATIIGMLTNAEDVDQSHA